MFDTVMSKINSPGVPFWPVNPGSPLSPFNLSQLKQNIGFLKSNKSNSF